MNTIKTGIIGYGVQGAHYTKLLKESDKCPKIQLVAVSERNADKRKEAAAQYPDLVLFEKPQEMLKSGLIDSCIICVPHFQHLEYVKACLNQGIHVLCEKPLAVYSLQAREMINEAEKHPELVFAAMFNQRTNHVYRKLKEIIEEKQYGQIRHITWIACNWYRKQAYFDQSAWRGTWIGEGGGVFINQAMHQLDLFQWLFGMPETIDARLEYGLHHDIETEDEGTVLMKYPNGTSAIFITSTSFLSASNRLEVNFDQSTLIAENDRLYVRQDKELSEIKTDGKNEQHTGVLNNFAAAILHDEPLLFSGPSGLNCLLLCNGIYLSSFLKQKIELPFDEELYFNLLKEKISNSHLRETDQKQ